MIRAFFPFTWTSGAANPVVLPVAAGRPRRKRWAVEWEGEYIEFSSSQAAIGWLRRQNRRIEKAVESTASKIEEKPSPIPLTAIRFDGERIASVMVEGKRAIDRIKTMRDAEIAMVERELRERANEDSMLEQILYLFD